MLSKEKMTQEKVEFKEITEKETKLSKSISETTVELGAIIVSGDSEELKSFDIEKAAT